MANEIQISVSAILNNTSGAGSAPLVRTVAPTPAQITQATKLRGGHGQNLTTSWETIDIGDVVAGYIFLTNMDATYNVDLGVLPTGSGATTAQFATIDPGDPPAAFHLASGVTLQARASGGSSATAAVDVEIWSV